jgi:hypothetical protein
MKNERAAPTIWPTPGWKGTAVQEAGKEEREEGTLKLKPEDTLGNRWKDNQSPQDRKKHNREEWAILAWS